MARLPRACAASGCDSASTASANDCLQVVDRLLGLAEHELEAAEVEHQAADVALVVQLLVDRLRLLRVVPRGDPVAHALCDERGLEVRVRDRAPVVGAARELERCLDVLAGRLEVALAATAARPPAEDVGAQEVARKLGGAGEGERLVEERRSGCDARELVAADAEPEQDVGAVDVGELRALGELAGDEEKLDCLAHLAFLRRAPRPRRRGREPRARPIRSRRCRCRAAAKSSAASSVAVRLGERLGADEQCLDPAAQVGRDAAAEERGVDAELRREPGDRLGGRARLAALDLADVLLREAIARDLGLGQPGSEAQRAQPLAEPRGRAAGVVAVGEDGD